jgi:hypothetical protein
MHSDCVAPALRALKIALNDARWSSSQTRAQGLRRLALAQLGSRDHLDEVEFCRRVADIAVQQWCPVALRRAAERVDEPHKTALLNAATRCEVDGTAEAAGAAVEAAKAAKAAGAAPWAVKAAPWAAEAAAKAATWAAGAAEAAEAATWAAEAATWAAEAVEAVDKVLADASEQVVQILIEMRAPGCQWLNLTEAAA